MDFDYRLLAKYLAGAISAEEMAMVVQWSSISEENKHIFSEIAKLRVAEGFTKYNNVERIDAALKMVNSRVNVKKRFTLLFSAMKYAAIVILVLVVAISGYTYLKPEKYYTIAVSEDTNVKKVLLSDGTTVWLHSNSSLQIPASFLKENRNVVLKGEAFFDVAKKQKNPFNVYTKYVRVRVLGTAFDVKVNEKAKSVETTLVRGHIALLNQDGEQVMKMDPGEKVTYTKDDNKYLTEDVDANLCAAWIGRVNYNYDSKYMAEFSFRYDGNDKFAPGHRWGFFPSVSGAWRISQEPFMESMSSWLNNLKIRASYGTTGNDLNVENKQILNFLYKKRYIATPKEDDDTKDYGTYVFGNSLANSIKPGDTPNPDLTWATSHTYNGGIDFGFLNNRLTGSVDAFYRKETNILGPRTLSIPSTYGQVLAPENYAARSWKGGEFEMNWRDKAVGGQLEYTVYMNLGFSRDKWLTLDEEAIYKTGNLADLSKVGMADSRLIGYKAVGLIRTQEEVDALKAKGFKQFGRDPYLGGILFEDTRGDGYSEGPDGKIDSNDYYNLLSTNATPRINYGFGGSVKYKGIYVDLHFQGVGKYDRVMGIDGFHQYGGSTRPYYPIWTSNDCWSPENPNGKYPRVVGSSWYESGTGPTSFWLRNGAYLRLKNVNVGYDLPKNILHVVGLSKAQIFMNATNLFYISAVGEFMDPEQKYYDSYPLMKTFTFGLNVTF